MKSRTNLVLLAVAIMLLGAGLAPRAEATDYTTTQNGNWNTNSTWGGTGFPNAATDNAIISAGHTVTVAQAGASYTVSNLTVNGVLTHSANSTVATTPYFTIDLTILGALNVAGTGMIDAKGKGFSAGNGFAPGVNNQYAASHGGLGVLTTTRPNTTYGSVTNPIALGSGGSGSYGGGAIALRVSGGTTVDGLVRADAADHGDWVVGASGGSVNLLTDTLSGSGTISANGNTAANTYGKSGGGGRVAVKLLSGSGVNGVKLRALGGKGGYGNGAPGTVYLQTTGQGSGQGTLTVDAYGIGSGEMTLISSNTTGAVAGNVIVGTNCALAVASNATLALSGNVSGYTTNDYLKLIGGTLTVPSAFSISNCSFWIANPSTLSASSVTVASNGVWVADFPASLSGSLTVQGGGRITHSANSTVAATPYYKIDLTIGGGLTVETNGLIDAKAKGFQSQNGPGKSSGGGTGGASHGGLGGNAGANPTYGSVTNPATLGSGGSHHNGGGAVILRASGACVLHGIVLADGGHFTSTYQEGAAGGSVYLSADTLTGTGILSANGNTNSIANSYSGGGGGRIAVKLGSGTDFGSVVMQAFGGPGTTYGAAGTIYRQTGTQTAGQGDLVIDNRGSSSTATTLISTNVTDAMGGNAILGTNAILAVASNTTLVVSGNVSATTNSATLKLIGGTLTVPSAFSVSNYTFWIANVSTCSPATSLTIMTNGVLLADTPHSIAGNLVVNGGGLVTHSANSTVAATPYSRVDLTIGGSLTVAANARIDAKAKGFSGGNPGNGPAPATSGNGASHGGLGGGPSLATYGSVTNPTTLGSGGNTKRGGGAVSLRVSGAATVDGVILAEAEDKTDSWGLGASGGSINLSADTLSGTGTVSASAGRTSYNYPAGGGGRVAVKLMSGAGTGSVVLKAYGESSSDGAGNSGAAGTIYVQTTGQGSGQGTLIVDAGGLSASAATLISTNVTERQAGMLIVTNSAVFSIASNVAFTVISNFLNYAQTASLCATGGTFVVGGSGTTTFGGTVTTNRFYNFTCTNAGKRLVFPSGSSNRVDGVLKLEGAAGNLLVLESSGAGAWRLSVPSPSSLHSVRYVDVTNSDARGGATIFAYDGWVNRGGNSNWEFVAAGVETNTWTGGTSTNWGTAGNWSDGVPTDTHTVRIMTNNNPGFWPVLNDHTELKTLLLGAGAQMSLGGKNLTVNTNMVVAGTLVASGMETVTIKGNANWAGGTFTKASSTLVIGGTGSQALDFNGIAFNGLRAQNASALAVTGTFSAVAFTNTGGALTFQSSLAAGTFANLGGALAFSNAVTVGTFSSTNGNLTFGGNVAATNFSVLTPGATVSFKAGGVYDVTNLTLGGSGTNRMVLVSSSPGTKWNLNVSGVSYVSGVTVSDSDASGGLAIRPVASLEGTPLSTVNWIFDGLTWKVWTGGSTDFHASGNWNPAGIPGPGDSLLIERTNGIAAPVQTVALTNANLAIGGLGPASLELRAPMTVTNSVTILPQGVLTHTANSTVAATPYYKVDLTIGGDLTINSSAAIDVLGKGFAGGQGPAPGSGNSYGASHGGLAANDGTLNPNTTYGSITNPTTLGSGGATLSPGGGAVILRVTGTTTIEAGGFIRADAPPQNTDWAGGQGGAGGSVNLRTAILSGNGTISANANTSSGTYVWGGGGGRVAVKLTSGSSFDGVSMSAIGGGGYRGAPGTIYLETAGQASGEGALIVNAGGNAVQSGVSALISVNVTDRQIGSLIVTNGGVFAIGTNVAFTITSNFLNYAQTASLCETGGTFVVGGSGTMTFGGTVTTNRFYNFTCTNAGKRIVFASGSSNVLDGVLTLQGAAGNEVQLASSGAAQWKLKVPSPWAGSVSYVDVTNSDARAGATIVAMDSINRGNNTNWTFASTGPVTNTWKGTSSSDWGTIGNWDQDRLPINTDIIRITPANSPTYWPVLNDHVVLMTLLVESGAQMSLGSKNLTVQTNMVMAGTLIASGSETVTMQGDANWLGGTFTKASSTVVLGGSGPQALDFSGIAFNNMRAQNTSALTVTGSFSAVTFTNTGGALTFPGTLTAVTAANAGGSLSFSNSLTVGSFSSTSGHLTFGGDVTATNFSVFVGGVTLTFKAGSVYAITNLTLYGSATNRITLVSSSPGTKWNLNVSGGSYVAGVTVSDSDASGGLTIRPLASAEGTPGSTINWVFVGGTSVWKTWIGMTTDFAAGGNWSPAGTPTMADSLMIERTNGIAAPLMTNTMTVANLALGGFGAASLTLQAPLTVTNRVAILSGGVLTHPANGAVTDPVLSVDLTAGGDLVVAPGGAIDATAKGYADGPAPGNNWQWGGSHGGMGYISVAHAYTTYGSVTNPILPGSRGSFGGAENEPGGGVVILRVTGDATVDGTIRADARSPAGSNRDGGSGGSVNLKADRLSGSGAISANSNTNSMHGGGGGGRVAVKLTTGTSVGSVAIQALGGPGSSGNGAPGTVYLQTGAQTDGQGALIVDANGYGAGADVTTLISSNVTDAGAVGDVLIRNSAAFAMASNTAISVAGSWSNGATFAGASNSVVSLAGASTVTVYGASTFGMLAITSATKTVYFQATRTNWVNGGLLARNAKLLSTADNTQWHIRLATNAIQDVWSVLARDSNATNGQTIIVRPSGRDLGNNVNWYFQNDPGTVFRMR